MVVELGFACRAVSLEKGERQVVIVFVNHQVTRWCRYNVRGGPRSGSGLPSGLRTWQNRLELRTLWGSSRYKVYCPITREMSLRRMMDALVFLIYPHSGPF